MFQFRPPEPVENQSGTAARELEPRQSGILPWAGALSPPSTGQAHGRKQEAVSGGARGRGTAAPSSPASLSVPAAPPLCVPHRRLPFGVEGSEIRALAALRQGHSIQASGRELFGLAPPDGYESPKRAPSSTRPGGARREPDVHGAARHLHSVGMPEGRLILIAPRRSVRPRGDRSASGKGANEIASTRSLVKGQSGLFFLFKKVSSLPLLLPYWRDIAEAKAELSLLGDGDH
ncbi:hypothetical protein J1605_021625 [Eschrichtius robustus]|uniref:Uncharacterized protein n=1 Tax=Eschrichtius robustus TaxID=9764 RepID=A0AB34HEY8_ESCRO|nr:hypothetical protein J1605_021625 [Eschrichtius robustus]